VDDGGKNEGWATEPLNPESRGGKRGLGWGRKAERGIKGGGMSNRGGGKGGGVPSSVGGKGRGS